MNEVARRDPRRAIVRMIPEKGFSFPEKLSKFGASGPNFDGCGVRRTASPDEGRTAGGSKPPPYGCSGIL